MLEETVDGLECQCMKKRDGRTKVTNELLCIVIDKSTFFDRFFYCREIGVGENHVRRQLGDISPAPHRHTNVCLFQSWCVIDPVACLKPQRQNENPKRGQKTRHKPSQQRVLVLVTSLQAGSCARALFA